ncbi:hypothetical protein BaRGS_00034209 [Batillaria attramentaria]|uniref:Uncharacterized protein n=1 Tax=Batillaria attramentaria TaxID=370345 RepID=A0ABD0JI11_9CAEN
MTVPSIPGRHSVDWLIPTEKEFLSHQCTAHTFYSQGFDVTPWRHDCFASSNPCFENLQANSGLKQETGPGCFPPFPPCVFQISGLSLSGRQNQYGVWQMRRSTFGLLLILDLTWEQTYPGSLIPLELCGKSTSRVNTNHQIRRASGVFW